MKFIKHILFALIVCTSFLGNAQVAGNYLKKINSQSSINEQKQTAFDYIASISDHVIAVVKTSGGSGGVYSDAALTTDAVNGNNVLAIKAFGNNPGSVVNMPHANPTGFPVSSALVWWKDISGSSSITATLKVYDKFERFIDIKNAPLGVNQWETNPGSLSSNKVNPVDCIFELAYSPGVSYESLAVPLLWKDEGGVLRVGGMLTSQATPYYTRNIYRFKIDGSGNGQVWLNGVSIFTTTGQSYSTNEFTLGTNSHTPFSKFYCSFTNFGTNGYSNDQVSDIYSKLNVIWPTGNPSYPVLTDMWQGGFNSWNGTAWQPGRTYTPVFTGGTGTAGTHLYQWYYWDANDATLFPSADQELTNHRQIPTSIDITSMASGNNVSVISIDGVNLMSSTVTWATSSTATAAAIVSNINAAQSNYLAVQRTSSIQIHPVNNNYRLDVIAFTASGFTPTIVQSGKSSTLTGSTYNVLGQIYNGHFTDATIKTMCIITPRDSNGVLGEPIMTGWTAKNF